MRFPPVFIRVSVVRENRKVVGFWFPFLILWPILAGALVLALPVALAVDIVMTRRPGAPGFTDLLLGAFAVLGEMTGTHVNVVSKERGDVVKVDVV